MILFLQNLAEDGESSTPRFPCDCQNSNTQRELMEGDMESELAFTLKIEVFQLTRMNFGFVRHTFITNNGTERVKINYFILFLIDNVRLLCSSVSKL